MSSPSQQIGKCQPGATEPIVEPDAEVVQRHPRCQTRPQTLELVGPLPPQSEGVKQLAIDGLYDLADGGDPPAQAFGPAPLSGVALGRMDDASSIAFEPPPVVFGALKTSRAERSRADEPPVRGGPHGEEGLRQSLVGGGGGPETEAPNDPGGSVAVSRLKPSYHPMLLDQPTSAWPASHPAPRRLQSLVGIAELSSAS